MYKMLMLAIGMFFGAVSASAETTDIVVSGAWVRASLGQSPTTAAYMKIENRGAKDDLLLEITTPVAELASVHESVIKNGIMQMEPVGTALVNAGGVVEMKPGGLHVMVTGLKAPLVAGQKIRLTLRFEKAGKIEIQAEVKGLGAAN